MYLQNLQQDEIFVSSEMKSLKSLTQMESRRGLENAIISNGKIVNVVSNSYGHIPNQLFFKKAEEMLTDEQLNFHKRTINKNDRSFITDFIIDDKSQFTVKNHKDLILRCFGSRIRMTEVKRPLDTLGFTGKYVQMACTFLKRKSSFPSSTVRTIRT